MANKTYDAKIERWTRRFFPNLYALKDTEIVAVTDECEDGERSFAHARYNFAAVVGDLRGDGVELSKVTTAKDLCDLYHDVSDYIVGVYTAQEWDAKRAIERARELESSAARIASAHGVNVYSEEFFDACESDIERQQSYREGLREDGLCATGYPGSMAGFEQWSEMNDDSHSAESHASQILNWASENMPLLYGKWKDKKAATA